jgi:hypothetical protein
VRQQAPGAGDEPAIDNQPGLFRALDKFVLPATADVGGYLGRWSRLTSSAAPPSSSGASRWRPNWVRPGQGPGADPGTEDQDWFPLLGFALTRYPWCGTWRRKRAVVYDNEIGIDADEAEIVVVTDSNPVPECASSQ